MGRAKTFQTLGNVMQPTDVLTISCPCGHRGSFSRSEAFKLFGPGAAPMSVRKAAVCRSCGASGLAGVKVTAG